MNHASHGITAMANKSKGKSRRCTRPDWLALFISILFSVPIQVLLQDGHLFRFLYLLSPFVPVLLL